MAGKKGMIKYPSAIVMEVVQKHRDGQPLRALSREYGISRYAIQSWCGLRPEVNIRHVLPLKRGRKPAVTLQDYKYENKRLKMENELLRDFLRLAGRK